MFARDWKSRHNARFVSYGFGATKSNTVACENVEAFCAHAFFSEWTKKCSFNKTRHKIRKLLLNLRACAYIPVYLPGTRPSSLTSNGCKKAMPQQKVSQASQRLHCRAQSCRGAIRRNRRRRGLVASFGVPSLLVKPFWEDWDSWAQTLSLGKKKRFQRQSLQKRLHDQKVRIPQTLYSQNPAKQASRVSSGVSSRNSASMTSESKASNKSVPAFTQVSQLFCHHI